MSVFFMYLLEISISQFLFFSRSLKLWRNIIKFSTESANEVVVSDIMCGPLEMRDWSQVNVSIQLWFRSNQHQVILWTELRVCDNTSMTTHNMTFFSCIWLGKTLRTNLWDYAWKYLYAWFNVLYSVILKWNIMQHYSFHQEQSSKQWFVPL